ncbi:MAG: transposase [Nitrospirae bacterium]|nr:transposase [Nitrospirota bacterium]
MARPLRIEYPGALYHLTARGNRQQDIYLDDQDREFFLKFLGREIQQQGWKCYAYCLMTNHYHILIETPEGNLVDGMRRLNGVYTQAFNRRHGMVGHVFQGRYKSIIVDRENYLLELCRYIVLNPIRAGIVAKIEEWPWSSLLPTMGLEKPPEWLETKWVLSQFGRGEGSARVAYQRFVKEGIRMSSPWENLRGQIWLGKEEFLKESEKQIEHYSLSEVPKEQSQPMRPQKEEVLNKICQVYGVGQKDIFKRHHQEAYHATVYLFRQVVNLRLKEVAKMFGISSSRVSHLQRQAERRNPDQSLQKLMRLYKGRVDRFLQVL